MTGILWLLARRHVVRSLTTGGIVVVAVAFVVTSLTLSDSLRATVTAEISAKYAVADVYASGPEYVSDDAVEAVRSAPGVTAVAVDGARSARTSVTYGSDIELLPLAEQPDLRWQVLTAGRWPSADSEVMSGDTEDIGRTLHWLPSDSVDEAGQVRDVTVVGAVDLSPSADGNPRFVAPPSTLLALDPESGWEGLLVTGDGDADELAAVVRSALAGAGVDSPQAVPATEQAEADAALGLTGSAGGFGQLLLVLAGITLLVAVMVISTTHGAVMSQRTRQLALLRCLGTSRGQLTVAGLGEALILGVVASVAGAVAGLGVAAAVIAVVSGYDLRLPTAQLAVEPGTVAIGVAVGVVTTLVSSWGPVRRATRVTPVAALRPTELLPTARRTSRTRLVVGILLAGGGAAVAAVIATTSEAMGYEGLYAAIAVLVSFIGVVVLARPLTAGLLGLLAARVGGAVAPASALGLAYARRNAHRSGALAASLLVGVTLMAAATAGASAGWASIAQDEDRADIDVYVGQDVLDDIARDVSDVPGVAGVLGFTTSYGSIAPLNNEPISEANILPVISETIVTGASFPAGAALMPPAGTLFLSPGDAADLGVADGGRVRVTGESDAAELVADVDPESDGVPPRVSPQDMARLGVSLSVVEVNLIPGSAAQQGIVVDAVAIAVAAGAPTARFIPWIFEQGEQQQFFDTLLTIVGGLLGLSFLVAMLGMAATFAVAVHERGRDLALVRALGMDRREAASIIVTEAAVLGAAAAILGMILGTGYALGTVLSFVGRDYFTADLPVLRLTVLAAVAVLAAVLAAGVPAYRSSRVVPAAGLTTFG